MYFYYLYYIYKKVVLLLGGVRWFDLCNHRLQKLLQCSFWHDNRFMFIEDMGEKIMYTYIIPKLYNFSSGCIVVRGKNDEDI